MPNLIETYALQTGLKIDKPMPFEHFFPLSVDKYILISNSSGMDAKNYAYFNDVIQMIKPYLPDYAFIQIGNKDDHSLNDVIHLQGMTTIPQMMYLIRGSSMLIGNDSSAAHIAGGYNKPVVALYGSTHPKVHGPPFGDKQKQRLIESHRNGDKPSYSSIEVDKMVNLIRPEDVAQAALDLMGVDKKLGIETVALGKNYYATTLELVLNQILNPADFQNIVLNARMDFEFNEGFLYQNLAHHKLCIITNKPFAIDIVKRWRQNVSVVAYTVDTLDYNTNFVKELRQAGIPYTIISSLKDRDLATVKLDFFDYGVVQPKNDPKKEDIENADKISKHTMYRSNRYILSNGKIYLNHIDWKEDKPRQHQLDNEGVVIDDPDFWKDSDYFYIYNKQNGTP